MLMMDHFDISEVEIYFIETVNNLCLAYFVVEIVIKLIGIYYFYYLFIFIVLKKIILLIYNKTKII
jgi:hypothetical protein